MQLSPLVCLVTVFILSLFLTAPCVGLRCVIVVFPAHTHLAFCYSDVMLSFRYTWYWYSLEAPETKINHNYWLLVGNSKHSTYVKCSKTCVKWQVTKMPKVAFNTNYRKMQVKSIAECSPWIILQLF